MWYGRSCIVLVTKGGQERGGAPSPQALLDYIARSAHYHNLIRSYRPVFGPASIPAKQSAQSGKLSQQAFSQTFSLSVSQQIILLWSVKKPTS